MAACQRELDVSNARMHTLNRGPRRTTRMQMIDSFPWLPPPPKAARYAFNIRLIVICILEPNSAGSENIIYVSHMLYPRRAC